MSCSAGPDIIQDGLVLHLDAADRRSYPGSGTTWFDRSGNNNNVTLVNGPTFNGSNIGNISFDGVNDYGYIPYTSTLAPTAQISFEAYVFKYNWGDKNNFRIISKTESGGWQMGAGPLSYIAGYLGALVYIAGSYRSVKYNLFLLKCGWHHFCFTFDGRYLKMYIDGLVVDTYDHGSASPIVYAYNNNLGVAIEADAGASNSVDVGGGYYTGNIANIKVYNKALTQSEVIQNYNAIKSRYEITPLQAYCFPLSSLIVYYDAANPASYPGTGNTWYNIQNTGYDLTRASVTYNASGYFTFVNNAVSFFYNTSYGDVLTNTEITIEIWFRWSGGQDFGLFSYALPADDNHFLIYYENALNRFNIYGGLGVSNISYTLSANAWTQIVVQNQGLYINGSYIGLVNSMATKQNGYLVIGQEQDSVGGGFDPAQDFVGDLAIIKIWNYILTSQAISANYVSTKSRFGL